MYAAERGAVDTVALLLTTPGVDVNTRLALGLQAANTNEPCLDSCVLCKTYADIGIAHGVRCNCYCYLCHKTWTRGGPARPRQVNRRQPRFELFELCHSPSQKIHSMLVERTICIH
jgi:hypothetical protein